MIWNRQYLVCGFPPPALRATSPLRASEGAETGEANESYAASASADCPG